MFPEQRTGDPSKPTVGSSTRMLAWAPGFAPHELQAEGCGQERELGGGACLAHLLYKPDDAGTLFLAEGHGARQAVELP